MRYKLRTYDNYTFFLDDKKHLFHFFDQLVKNRHSLQTICSDRFDLSKGSGRFRIGSELKTSVVYDDVYYNIESSIYVNAWYIIEDFHGYTVNYDKIFHEYDKSRREKKKKSGCKFSRRFYGRHSLDSSTKRYRKAMKFQDLKQSRSSGKKEYIDLLICKEDGLKVRSKRFDFLRQNHVHYYLDEYNVRKDTTSWKDNKKTRKQWQKRQQ